MNDISAITGATNYTAQLLPIILAAQKSNLAKVGSSAEVAAKQEFYAIFYKEMLKQVFKAPDLSLGDEEDSPSPFKQITNDAFVDKLAQQMAQKAALQSSMVAKIR